MLFNILNGVINIHQYIAIAKRAKNLLIGQLQNFLFRII